MNKKAQGLPFNTIVLIIIAIFILILIIAWVSGALGTIFGQTKTVTEATDADLTAVQTKCSQYCLQAQGADSEEEWKASLYCTYATPGDKDWSGDNKLTSEDEIHCYNNKIASYCSTTVGGEKITQDDC